MNASPPAERRARIPAEEARRRILEAGLRAFRETGLTVGIGGVGFEDVIKAADVSRTAAYRAWKDRDAFLADLYLAVVEEASQTQHVFSSGASGSLAAAVAASADLLATADGRRALLVEICRVGASRNFTDLHASAGFQTVLGIVASLGSVEPEHRDLAEAILARTEVAFVERLSTFYRDVAAVFGCRPRPGITFDDIAVIGGSFIQGTALEARMLPDVLVDVRLDLDPFDTGWARAWTLPALGFTSFFLGAMEMLPDGERPDPAVIERFVATYGASDASPSEPS
ncbi:TetR/AcrR family transcriptional regulator [Nocardioides sp. AE5]|uniref:TetR/AcrR family transcriptional regulator n=1 Tax=Nocardioides sp. AE5 TaxID=2962573 RepID=UPI002880EA1E|nr:TetR/AcrR family transcriptional regulator [Nocardioides sp. AE5]MDT0202947.1 TetR/AcrR family transcriptional regulator [Nocardioides sp. AE5]